MSITNNRASNNKIYILHEFIGNIHALHALHDVGDAGHALHALHDVGKIYMVPKAPSFMAEKLRNFLRARRVFFDTGFGMAGAS